MAFEPPTSENFGLQVDAPPPPSKNGKRVAENLVRGMIALIGDDPMREGLRETPERVVKAWGELFSGYHEKACDHVKVFSAAYSDQIITVRGINFFSMCEHHMLPFFGTVAVGYLPRDSKILGVSKIARIVNVYARRLQLQERMTSQIADAICDAVDPAGVGVIVDGKHLCMMARGVEQQKATMRTSCMAGLFLDNGETRAEVMALLAGPHD